MIDTPAASTARGGRRRGGFFAVILLVGLAIVLAGVFPFRQMIAQQRLVDNTQAELNALVGANEDLLAQIDAVQSEAELERIAREQYGMARPGETIYVVELEDSGGVGGVIESEPTLDSRSLLERFWDFLTGRDLVPDG
ncbi:MAG: septum formation initiator family protein [Acidimicrobiia bacterium]|nr:septum formation initiator family protein [Acidimicrobiia bacterium]